MLQAVQYTNKKAFFTRIIIPVDFEGGKRNSCGYGFFGLYALFLHPVSRDLIHETYSYGKSNYLLGEHATFFHNPDLRSIFQGSYVCSLYWTSRDRHILAHKPMHTMTSCSKEKAHLPPSSFRTDVPKLVPFPKAGWIT